MFLGQKIIRTFINILALADFLFLTLLDRKNFPRCSIQAAWSTILYRSLIRLLSVFWILSVSVNYEQGNFWYQIYQFKLSTCKTQLANNVIVNYWVNNLGVEACNIQIWDFTRLLWGLASYFFRFRSPWPVFGLFYTQSEYADYMTFKNQTGRRKRSKASLLRLLLADTVKIMTLELL